MKVGLAEYSGHQETKYPGKKSWSDSGQSLRINSRTYGKIKVILFLNYFCPIFQMFNNGTHWQGELGCNIIFRREAMKAERGPRFSKEAGFFYEPGRE